VPAEATKRNGASAGRSVGVPFPPRLFLGRADDVVSFSRRLIGAGSATHDSLQVLRGWPGLGKTALATVVARASDVLSHFVDGVFWLSLGPSPHLAATLSKLGAYLDMDALRGAGTVGEAVDALGAWVAQKRALVILDDVWEADHLVPFKAVSDGGSVLVATTRLGSLANDLLVPDTAVYRLGPLLEQDAMDLLAQLWPPAASEHRDASLHVVRSVECLPLAVVVAGRLLSAEAKRGWGVDELLRDLQEGSALIAARAPADRLDLETQTLPTVAALLSLSTQRLDDYTRACFARLAPMAPRPAVFGLDTLKACWAVDDPRPVARRLIDNGLLEPIEDGYQIHALLVTHAKTLLGRRDA
jgi:NB-ARC domain-containing protein